MVTANVNLEAESNKIVNFVKTTKEFKDKSEVINYIIMEYADKVLDEDKFNEQFIRTILANRQSNPSERVDITDEAARREFLGL